MSGLENCRCGHHGEQVTQRGLPHALRIVAKGALTVAAAKATNLNLVNLGVTKRLGAIAQFETEIRAERQKDGIQKAKERGVKFGKKKKLSPQQITELQSKRQQGVLIKTLMKDYDLSKASVYRYLNEK